MSELAKVSPIDDSKREDSTLVPLNADGDRQAEVELVDSSRGDGQTSKLLPVETADYPVEAVKALPSVDEEPDDENDKEVTEEEVAAKLAQRKKELAVADQLADKEADENLGKLLCGFLKEQWWLLMLGVPFMFLAPLGDLVVPSYIGFVCNAMLDKDHDLVVSLIRDWAIFMSCGALAAFLNKITFGYACERMGRSVRAKLFDTTIRKDITFFDETKTGDIISRIASDTMIIQEGLSTSVAMFIQMATFCVVVLIIMFNYDVYTTLVAVALVIPGSVVAPVYSKINKKCTEDHQSAKAKANGAAEETISNIRTVKAFAEEKGALARFRALNDEIYRVALIKGTYWGFFMFFMKLLTASALAGLILFVNKQVQDGNLSIGEIMAYLLYMQTLTRNVGEMVTQLQQISRVEGATKAICKIMLKPQRITFDKHEKPEFNCCDDEDDNEDKDVVKADNQISLTDVNFHYPTKPDVPIVRGVSLDVKRNHIVALVGASGCGKSSIICLVERWYDPASGTIKYNGEDLKNVDNRWYHQTQVSLVQQEPILFSDCIRDNILYGVDVSGMSKEQVDQKLDDACKQAFCYDFIHDEKQFPQGYDTEVGEKGVRLSGGQKQRVAIARALVRDPEVILLDEATSALDADSEHEVQKSLDKLMEQGGKTIMVIAHRLSTIKGADNIVVLKYGQVVEQGTHDQLVAKNGVYKQLVDRQLTKEKLEEDL